MGASPKCPPDAAGHSGGALTARGEGSPRRMGPRSPLSQQPLRPHGRIGPYKQPWIPGTGWNGLQDTAQGYLDVRLPQMSVCKLSGGTGSVGTAAC